MLYILTYLLTPRSRVLLEKLTGSAASQEIPRVLWNPKVHHRTHKCPPPVPILSQLRFPKTSCHFLKIRLNIILPSTSESLQSSLSLRFPHQNPVHTSPLPHTRYMPCPSNFLEYYYCCCSGANLGPRQTRQLPRAVDLKGRLLSCQSY